MNKNEWSVVAGVIVNASANSIDLNISRTDHRSLSITRWATTIESFNPHNLTDIEFQDILEVNQDMWARWLGEFLECKNCNHISSKADIFLDPKYNLWVYQYKQSVKQIMKDLSCTSFDCPHCKNPMDEIYGTDYLHEIKSRLLDNESYLTLCKFNNKIVWYMDFFSTSLENAYEKDLKRHYNSVWFDEIKKRVTNILWYTPVEVFCFTSIWLLENHNSFFSVFQLLNISLQSVPDEYNYRPGITEISKNTNLHPIYTLMTGKSLGIADDPTLSWKIGNKQSWYLSDVMIFAHPVETFKTKFSIGIRQFLKEYWSKLNLDKI